MELVVKPEVLGKRRRKKRGIGRERNRGDSPTAYGRPKLQFQSLASSRIVHLQR